ncbi:hypothetical protein N7451_000135 [Penicillium sp. IBT 35674x]|nr:hypothetical protein N7451_000135 [Penicillium sp. IBT 35674x]
MVRVVSKPNRGKDFAGTFKVSIAGPGVPDAPGVKALNGLVAELTWHNYGLKKASVEGADILVEGIMGLVFSKKKYHLVIYADQIHR